MSVAAEAHAVLAPSSAYRWAKCAASVGLQKQYPEEETESSREGTAAHWLFAKLLGLWGLPGVESPSVRDWIGRKADNGVIITDEIAESAEAFILHILGVCNTYGCLRQLVIEERVDISVIHPQVWGTPDVWVYVQSNNLLILWDYKHGFKYVDAVKNYQLACYAIGIIQRLHLHGYRVDEVVFNIVQPRSYHHSGTVREWRPTHEDLNNLAAELSLAAEKVFMSSPQATTGAHCLYCTALHYCDGAQKAVGAALEYSGGAITSELPNADYHLRRDLLYRGRDILDAALEALEVTALSKIRHGEKLAGLTVKEALSNKDWTTDSQTIFNMGDALKIDLRKPPAAITPTQAIKKGVDKNLVDFYSTRTAKGLKLIDDSNERAKLIFSKKTGGNTND